MLRLSMEKRKDYIAAIAAKVFSEKGYKSSSLQEIADYAKISKAGIYHYFKTKDEILGHILIKNTDIFMGKLINSINDSKKKGLNQRDSFEKLISTFARHIQSSGKRRLIMAREMHNLTDDYQKELYIKQQNLFNLIKGELLKIENLDKKLDPNIITFMIIGTMNWIGRWYKDGKKLDLDAITKQNIRIFFHGMLKN
ncbi:MAG: TetR/AcrR family transcriptional regulator [Thermodesulfobacteriota bacterium]